LLLLLLLYLGRRVNRRVASAVPRQMPVLGLKDGSVKTHQVVLAHMHTLWDISAACRTHAVAGVIPLHATLQT
jgi:hypothetical protein